MAQRTENRASELLAAAVSGRPSWNTTPGRSRNTNRPPPSSRHVSVSAGVGAPANSHPSAAALRMFAIR